MDQQVHTQFKAFIAPPDHETGLLPQTLCAEVANFVTEHGVAAKSLGVEYIEHSRRIVLTLGYAKGQLTTPVRVECQKLGPLGNAPNEAEIEAAMEVAAEATGGILCHEFYVDEDGEFFLVLLAAA